MLSNPLGLLELAFILLVGLAWAAHEWWSLRKAAKAPPPADPPGP